MLILLEFKFYCKYFSIFYLFNTHQTYSQFHGVYHVGGVQIVRSIKSNRVSIDQNSSIREHNPTDVRTLGIFLTRMWNHFLSQRCCVVCTIDFQSVDGSQVNQMTTVRIVKSTVYIPDIERQSSATITRFNSKISQAF